MTLRQYMIIMVFATALCWIAWIFVIFNIDPFEDKGLGIFFFYTSLFLAVLGTVSMVDFTIRYFFGNTNVIAFQCVRKSFLDGILISFVLAVLLYLQSKSYLSWWNLGVGLTALFLFLLFIVFNKSKMGDDRENIQ